MEASAVSNPSTSTLVEDPPPHSEGAVLRPRTRRAVAGALIIGTLVAATALLLWADHYQPLSQFSGGVSGSHVLTSTGAVADHNYTNGLTGQGNPNTVWNEPAGWYRVQANFTINNDGSLPVTIESVSNVWAESYNSHFKTFFDSKGLDDGFYGYQGGPSFHPSTLPGHGELTLAVHWTARCIPGAGETTTFSTIPVTYSFLGFTHTVSVPFDDFEIKYRSTC